MPNRTRPVEAIRRGAGQTVTGPLATGHLVSAEHRSELESKELHSFERGPRRAKSKSDVDSEYHRDFDLGAVCDREFDFLSGPAGPGGASGKVGSGGQPVVAANGQEQCAPMRPRVQQT